VTDPNRRQATVLDIAAPTPDVRVVRLGLSGAFDFQAGQYVRLWFGDLGARDYSLGSVPGAAELEFHIRVNAERGVGFYVGTHLKRGEKLELAGPFGDAYWRAEHTGPLLAVAGGTGVVPIKSIVETALQLGMIAPLYLYLGARTALDLYMEAHFRALAERHRNLRFVATVSEAEHADGHRVGNVSEVVGEDFDDLYRFKAYVAGPPAMVAATQEILRARGIDGADIHTDAFVPGDHSSRGAAAKS
jgi:CDP-4-dehydro-6-deoxyglucose reductase/ferredoxin-NAD(P)+ reductase (naphthalene dioxygenase ferredoxin-specific)